MNYPTRNPEAPCIAYKTEKGMESLLKFFNNHFTHIAFAQTLEWTEDYGEMEAQYCNNNITIDSTLEEGCVSLIYTSVNEDAARYSMR